MAAIAALGLATAILLFASWTLKVLAKMRYFLLLLLLGGCATHLVTSSDDIGGVQPVRWGVVGISGHSVDEEGRRIMADYCKPFSYRATGSRRALESGVWWLQVRFECVDLSKPPKDLPTIKS